MRIDRNETIKLGIRTFSPNAKFGEPEDLKKTFTRQKVGA